MTLNEISFFFTNKLTEIFIAPKGITNLYVIVFNTQFESHLQYEYTATIGKRLQKCATSGTKRAPRRHHALPPSVGAWAAVNLHRYYAKRLAL